MAGQDAPARVQAARRAGPTFGERLARNPMLVLWVWCGGAAAIGAVVLALVVGSPPRHGSGAPVFQPDPGGPRSAADYALDCPEGADVNEATIDGTSPVTDRTAQARPWADGSGLAERFPGYTTAEDGTGRSSVVLFSDPGAGLVAVAQFDSVDDGWRLSTVRYC